MCGICGIVTRERDYPVELDRLLEMRDSMEYRGPDDAGLCIRPGMGFGSRRLSILDLSLRAHMPMSTGDERYWITYNGEVYNFLELRAELEKLGYAFRSNSDTEVVLNAYVEYGPAMLKKLNGMFAIAIWDQRKRTLFLARDRLGVKPLYYASLDSKFYFASEEKALFAAGVVRNFDPACWEELLCFRYVAGERTPYVGVKRLLPGHYLLWTNGDVQTHRWWHLGQRVATIRDELPSDSVGWFSATFDDAVKARRISDVPIGVLLSGGLDSSSVAASLATQAGNGVASFTVRFKEPSHDEGPLAREVADRWKLDHHELFIDPSELLQRLHYASRLNDEPLVHGNDLHLQAISHYAKSRVTVLLSGEGGDETLGGYVRYRPLWYPRTFRAGRGVFPSLVKALALNGRMKKLARFCELGSIEDFVLFNSCDILPANLHTLGMKTTSDLTFRRRVLAEAKTTYPKDPFRQAMYCDTHTFLCSILDRNDRMTMGASIECRVPFLDYRLVEGLAALPTRTLLRGRQNKQLLRAAAGDRLPEAVLRHRKWGFGVPWKRYLREIPELRQLVEKLPDVEPLSSGPLDRMRLRNAVQSFLRGDNSHDVLIQQLTMIAVWHQACFRPQTTAFISKAQNTSAASSVALS